VIDGVLGIDVSKNTLDASMSSPDNSRLDLLFHLRAVHARRLPLLI